MKLILKVTGVTKVTDDKQLVQLQGKFGNVSLNLPLTARVTIGDEFVLGRHQETALVMSAILMKPAAHSTPRFPIFRDTTATSTRAS
jgi:hypothetical protein